MKTLIWAGGVSAAVVLMAGVAQAQAPTPLADAKVGQAYSSSLAAPPGLPTNSTVINGSIPTGLDVGPMMLSGTPGPGTAGPYTFTVRTTYMQTGCPVMPCGNGTDDRSYTLRVQPDAPAAVPTLGEWAMLGLTGALALVGGALVSRRFVVRAG